MGVSAPLLGVLQVGIDKIVGKLLFLSKEKNEPGLKIWFRIRTRGPSLPPPSFCFRERERGDRERRVKMEKEGSHGGIW